MIDLLLNDDNLYIKIVGCFFVGAFGLWTAIKWWVERRDRKLEKKHNEEQLKKKAEYNYLDKKVYARKHELLRMELGTEANILNEMIRYTKVTGGANIVNYCECKNGGDFITHRKPFTLTIKYEKISESRSVEPRKPFWQGVPVPTQLAELLRLALLDGYVYYEDYLTSMPDGNYKSFIRPEMGEHIAFFYIGCIDIEHYFFIFQFRKANPQTKTDLLEMMNIAKKINKWQIDNDNYKKTTRILMNQLEEMRTDLVRSNLL